MFRLAQTFTKTLTITSEPLSNLQTVRWRRKPRWVPIAKSKQFRVPTRPVVPKIETEEMLRLHNNYRTVIKSIRRNLTQKYELTSRQTIDPEVLKKAFEEDYAKCKALNDEWNVSIKSVREARFIKEVEEEVNIAKQRLIVKQKIKERKFQQAEEIVKKQKAVAHTFITRENVDDSIEKAISNVVDYNYAIESNGNKISGRETKPDIVQEKVGVKQ